MLERIGTDIWSNVETVFISGDPISSGIALVIALVAGLLIMKSFGQIINMVVGSLVVFGLAQVVYGIVTGGADVSTETAISNSWDSFMAVTMGVLLVYFIAFFVVISVAYAIRSALRR